MLVATALTGCATPTVEQSLTATAGGNDFANQAAFWSQLHDQAVVSNDDAFHALLLYIEQEDPAADYGGRVEAMRAHGLLPDGFVGAANEAVTRGTLAVAIARLLKIEGGVMMRLMGATPRYATRELWYIGLYPPSSPQQVFSGAQFVAVMGRMEDHARRAPPYAPAEEAPGDAPAGDI